MSNGGLLQLVAVGPEDAYLNVDPTVNFFETTYQRYENFGREPIIGQFTGQAGNGRTISIDIPRTADLLHKTYLRLKITYELFEKNKDGNLTNDIKCKNAQNFFLKKHIKMT